MQAPSNEPKSSQVAASLLGKRGARMSNRELTRLIYNREMAGLLTPAERVGNKDEDKPFRQCSWKRQSAFGRWRIFR